MDAVTVYVVQEPTRFNRVTLEVETFFDLSPADQFGEQVHLLPPNAGPFNPDAVLPVLWEKLKDFGDSDYLLLIGNPILIGWATAVAADYNEGRVNLLQWSGAKNSYIPVFAQVFPVDPEPARG